MNQKYTKVGYNYKLSAAHFNQAKRISSEATHHIKSGCALKMVFRIDI